MSVFELYLRLGIDHIANLAGYDHILFIVALSIVYPLKQWRKLLILVTAFTIGHSTTLALATLNIIRIPTGIIEFLIPVTIFFTALANIIQRAEKISEVSHRFKYVAAHVFRTHPRHGIFQLPAGYAREGGQPGGPPAGF